MRKLVSRVVMSGPRARLAMVAIGWVLAACGGEDRSPALCETPDGRVYKSGDFFPAGDGCNTCQCEPEGSPPGGYGCTLIGCHDAGPPRLCEPVAGTACTLGPACGDGCCGQGEQCVEGVCRCGDGAACGEGEICGSAEPIGPDGCGVTCCPPEGPCG